MNPDNDGGARRHRATERLIGPRTRNRLRQTGIRAEPTASAGVRSMGIGIRAPMWHDPAVEFLNFVLIFTAGCLVLRRPERERLAFGLLVASCLLMATLFLIGARGSILPGLNY